MSHDAAARASHERVHGAHRARARVEGVDERRDALLVRNRHVEAAPQAGAELLDETRQTSLDEPGRKRLAEIYGRSVGELSDVLSGDLREELASLAPPIEGGVPTESELRVAQAQLVGWLEGLFHGIQAAMFAQQAAARAQFEELRRRGLLAQNPQGGSGPQENERTPGQYL